MRLLPRSRAQATDGIVRDVDYDRYMNDGVLFHKRSGVEFTRGDFYIPRERGSGFVTIRYDEVLDRLQSRTVTVLGAAFVAPATRAATPRSLGLGRLLLPADEYPTWAAAMAADLWEMRDDTRARRRALRSIWRGLAATSWNAWAAVLRGGSRRELR